MVLVEFTMAAVNGSTNGSVNGATLSLEEKTALIKRNLQVSCGHC